MIYLKNLCKSGLWVISLSLSLLNTGRCATETHEDHAASSAEVLKNISRDTARYGELIYKGTVFKLDTEHTSPLYVSEHRVRNKGELQISTSYTHDKHDVALMQMATHDAVYQLKEYTEYQFQLSEVGSVNITGTTAQFHRLGGEFEKRAQETVKLPVVVGPTLYGFVFQNWEKLLSGDTVPFRFAVISRMETVGFILQKVSSSDSLVRIRMKASNPFIALMVNPITFTFYADRRLVSLAGRVPTKLKKGNSWVDLDAFVEYENVSPSFR